MEKISASARPLTVLLGILMIFTNYCLIPLICRFIGKDSTPLVLPMEFWVCFGTATGLYNIARTIDKKIAFSQEKEDVK